MRTIMKARNATVDINHVSLNFGYSNMKSDVKIESMNKNFIPKIRREVKSLQSLPSIQLKALKNELMQIKETFELTFKQISTSKIMAINIFPWLNTTGIPPEFLELASGAVLILIGVVIIVAIIASLIASLLTMCNKEKDGERLAMNVRKGLIQGLTAIVVVIIICSLADFFFGGTRGYHPVTNLK